MRTAWARWLQTLWAIGPRSLCRLAIYRAGLRTGLNPVRRLDGVAPTGPFYDLVLEPVALSAPNAWRNAYRYFGWLELPLSNTEPDWFYQPFTEVRVQLTELPWWQISDFDDRIGDIKGVWELSRFEWVPVLAQQAATGDNDALTRLNHWLADWCSHNPPYFGPNWKCGQETAIRVMHLAMAAHILGQQATATPGLLALIRLHLARIAPTTRYAMAQDNNHGTSEAAALFIGGSWLARLADDSQGVAWAKAGRRWLEERAQRLIEADGSFSQYSVNYHRLMLDTLCMVEVWRRSLNLPAFSQRYRQQARAAAHWLRAFTCPISGDAPNIGANDGARLLPLTDTDYRDYRPTVQLAATLFAGATALADDGPWNLPLAWLRIPPADRQLPPLSSEVFPAGGYAVLRNQAATVYLRFPRFRFRPSHADALHLDLWLASENILRDAGSYLYNTESRWLCYFTGTAAHNTVQFDDRDQMPRLSRFLFGDWLPNSEVTELQVNGNETTFAAAYADKAGVRHRRALALRSSGLQVEDDIAGFNNKAVLRWRLAPGPWQLNGQSVFNGRCTITMKVAMPVVRLSLVEGWESSYYGQKNTLPVIELEVNQPGRIVTEIDW